MLTLLRNARLKYKFWLLNIVVFAVLCLLVLYAMQTMAGQTGKSFDQVFADTAPGFALVVAVLMVLEMAGSQLLISFIERHVNRLKNTMVDVQSSGNLSQRAVVDSTDEIGEMASAFNAMQDRTVAVVRSMKEAIDRLHREVEELTSAAEARRDDLSRQQQGADRSAEVIETMLQSFTGIAEQAGIAKTLSTKPAMRPATAAPESARAPTASASLRMWCATPPAASKPWPRTAMKSATRSPRSGYCRTDQFAGPERSHRGRPGRRTGPRVCCGG